MGKEKNFASFFVFSLLFGFNRDSIEAAFKNRRGFKIDMKNIKETFKYYLGIFSHFFDKFKICA